MTLKVTLAFWNLLTHSLTNMTRINFDMCTRIREHTWPVTLNELKGHSSISGLFKCNSIHLCSNLQYLNWHARVARSLSDSWASCCLNVVWIHKAVPNCREKLDSFLSLARIISTDVNTDWFTKSKWNLVKIIYWLFYVGCRATVSDGVSPP